MKPSSVALLLAGVGVVCDLALVILSIPVNNSGYPVPMFLCTSFICRAIEEYRK